MRPYHPRTPRAASGPPPIAEGPARPPATRNFSQFFEEELGKASRGGAGGVDGLCRSGRQVCHLCWASRYSYLDEAAAKGRALQKWARQCVGLPEPQWVPASGGVAAGRHYRCVSKRRWLHREQRLVMTDQVVRGRVTGLAVAACHIEPAGHALIYADLQARLPSSRFSDLVNYAILKGDLENYHLLLNLTSLRQQRSEVNRLSKKLTQRHSNLQGVWLVEGGGDDEYYLNPAPGSWQCLFGDRFIQNEGGLQFSPLCFTQVNPWMVTPLVEVVRGWLDDPVWPLLDLYCGYGLFGLSLERTGPTLGLELSREAVKWARHNASRLRSKAQFLGCDLAAAELGGYVRRLLGSDPAAPWGVVLDPPRGGAPATLVEQLVELGPRRVVHLVCDVEKTSEQAALWQDRGYRVERLVALDMFPGTSCLEIALCLSQGSPPPRGGAGGRV